MTVILKGFAQEAELENPSNVTHLLVFQIDGKRVFRVPVSAEASEALMREVYGASPSLQEPEEEEIEDVPEEEATVFGEEPEEDEELPHPPTTGPRYATSEDEIPSL